MNPSCRPQCRACTNPGKFIVQVAAGGNLLLCQHCRSRIRQPRVSIFDLSPEKSHTRGKLLLLTDVDIATQQKCERCKKEIHMYRVRSDRDYLYCVDCYSINLSSSDFYSIRKHPEIDCSDFPKSCNVCKKEIPSSKLREIMIMEETEVIYYMCCSSECLSKTEEGLGKENRQLTCAICTRPGRYRCGGCNFFRYCSSTHQAEDWPKHKLKCQGMAE